MTATSLFEQATAILAEAGQSHVLHGFDALPAETQASLLDEILAIDWPEVQRLVASHVLTHPEAHIPERIEPVAYYPRIATDAHKGKYKEADELGRDLIRLGKVAAFTVAGGQGTRLGFDGPKGSYPATPIRNATLFQTFAEQILKSREKYKAAVPWYVMTSTVNHAETVAFFETHDYFGLPREDVTFFSQQMMPAIDAKTGKVLLSAPGALALSPNGHGGALNALYTTGAIATLKERCVEHI